MNVISRTPVSNTTPPDLSLHYTPATSVNKRTICQVTNPDPLTGKTLGPFNPGGNQVPKFTGDKLSLSCQPDGTLEVRPEGADGAYEACVIDGAGNVTFWPGQAKLGSPLYFSTCFKFLGSADVPEVPPAPATSETPVPSAHAKAVAGAMKERRP